ncbi:DUF5305 family protein [Pyrococcus kukulkanii]|uniref:DUF5305 family protein n=1 Tax=Pyrococcus kukulkanii TaxID=1609559 RepID=UPI003564FF33
MSRTEKYEKWISRGKMPDSAFKTMIELSSLEDPIEAAIDMQKRVIYDDNLRIYFFVDDSNLYYFKPR